MNKYAVIMAGGAGTRLWPLSRRNRPKQLLHIVEGRSLIYKAFERLNAAFSPSDIYVIAMADHLPVIAEELPALPSENLIGEPVGRDTANAVALAAAILHEKSPDSVMGVFTADHVIRPTAKFVEIIKRGFAAAVEDADALVTFGIKPTEPHTGLGYIERGGPHTPGVWTVKSFKEKPDLDTARRYVASGDYYWNSGMFVWRTATILEQLRQHLSPSHAAVLRLAEAWNTDDGRLLAEELYPGLEKISIDFAVMEKAPKVLVVEMALDWLDIGNWTALPSVLGADSFGNTKALKRAATLSSDGNIFVTEEDHLIAAIGIKDLVVVHSPDATLVCRKDQIQRIKDLVADLDQEYDGLYS
ncbi:MAG: NTP transferase domain-containing protein [Phycisphaerae bacterium]|nr:NTP transferase domain-containing protein [Phycisphaerae bacterium]